MIGGVGLRCVIIGIIVAIILASPESIASAYVISTNNEISSKSEESYNMRESVELPFVENKGQVNDQVLYYANTFAGTVFITKDSITYSLPKNTLQKDDQLRGIAIKEEFVGGQTLNPVGLEKSKSVVSYFVGDQKNWKSDIPTFGLVSLGQVWNGIDVSIKAHSNNVEKIFTVHPGADVNEIKIEEKGVTDLQTESDGRLMLNTQLGNVTMTQPIAYQIIDGVRNTVEVSYHIDGTTYGFTVGKYDHNYELIIDPLLASTFIGGINDDFSRAMVVDSGNVYVAGYSESSNFPVTAGAYSTTFRGVSDVYVSKFDSSLSTLLASTFIGGSGIDYVYGMTVDSSHNVYVTGRTESSNFPVTAGAYSTTFRGVSDVYVSKFDSSLSTLLASTFIGGSDFDNARTIIINSGNVYVAGRTYSTDYPTTASTYQKTFKGNNNNGDAFVSELDPTLSTLLASTYLGGTGDDIAYWIAADSSNNLYVTGQTNSTNFPVTGGAYSNVQNGAYSVFISKLDSSLQNNLVSTYLGGNGNDLARVLVIDSSGNIYVAGHTNSTNFPTTAGAYNRNYSGADPVPNSGDGGSGDVFISKLNPTLSTLLASTYLGGSGNDLTFALALDSGNVYVAGTTQSPNFPTTGGAYRTSFNVGGSPDAFVSELDPTLSTLLASTYLGGTKDDAVRALVIDSSHNIYVTGPTNSPDYPVTSGAYSTSYGGTYDTFISKFDSCLSSGSINPISVTTVNNTSPRWGVDTVLVAGSTYNDSTGYTVTVNWGDGTSSTGIPITCHQWGPILHTYGSTATTSNPNQLSATLFSNTNSTVVTSTAIPVTVQKHPTSITSLTLNSISVKWGKSYSVTNSLLTDLATGLPIAGKTITYGGNGTTGSPKGITNSSGKITNPVTITAPGIYNVGKGNIFAKFAGDSAYQLSAAATTIQIIKHSTALSNPVFSVLSVLWGKNFTVDGRITDVDNNVPIKGIPITFSGNGTVTKTDFTNSTGYVETTLTAANSAGLGKINATFNGDNNYLSSSSFASIQIAKHATTISTPTFDTTSVLSGITFNADSVLTDSNLGSPVSGRQITYSGNGTSGPTASVTNATGHAPTTLTAPNTVGMGQVSAAFAGDQNYLQSNSNSASITITSPSITSSVNNTSPRWGIDSVAASGTVTNSASGDTMTVNWGDGTSSTGIPISGSSWGPVVHTYSSSAISTNPNQVIAKLVASNTSIKAASTASSVNVQKHATTLSTPTLSVSTIKWGKTFSITQTTLIDTDAQGIGISGTTITYTGTAVTGLPTGTTGNSGGLTNSVNATASTNVGAGQTVIANFSGDNSYLPSVSSAASITINPHITALSMPALKNVAWGRPTSFPVTLTDSDSGSSQIPGMLIHYNGTGVIGVSDQITNSVGQAFGNGTAPTSVANSWTVQGHFAGNLLYVKSDSVQRTYNTFQHSTQVSLIISPGTVVHGNTYKVSGILKDSTTGTVLSLRTITFTATSPITVSPTTTDSSGSYSVSGLVAPQTTGSYVITTNFAGDSLYKPSSVSKTLIVT